MKNKNSRLDAIRLIVSGQDVHTQEELLTLLIQDGYQVTQATLSRDLKRMKISKVANAYGDYLYVLPNHAVIKHAPAAEMSAANSSGSKPRYGFISLKFTGNMAVIKTCPGYASGLAYDIDNLNVADILGTIAGDDTLLIILSEDADRTKIKRMLEPVIVSL
ncbi:MAG: arginine repressor [Bacteroidaceae bacterium]|nr:arginine repressor [Bacteroidaceae bacterium]